MINIDEQALICDLAEVYHIYDYKSLPVKLVATFSVGLRDDSRIKMKMNGEKAPMKTIMLAMIADILSMMFWSYSGKESHRKPPLFTEMIFGSEEKLTPDISSFNTPESFEAARQRILKKGGA